jgi:hypothetical protein
MVICSAQTITASMKIRIAVDLSFSRMAWIWFCNGPQAGSFHECVDWSHDQFSRSRDAKKLESRIAELTNSVFTAKVINSTLDAAEQRLMDCLADFPTNSVACLADGNSEFPPASDRTT